MLTKEQMKKITGGYSGNTQCALVCTSMNIVYQCFIPGCYFDVMGRMHCGGEEYDCGQIA